MQGALRPMCPRGRSDRGAPTDANVSSGATFRRARLNPSGLTPGRLFGERGSILCSRSRIRWTGILQVSRHETLEKPESDSIIARTSDRMEGPGRGNRASEPRLHAAMSLPCSSEAAPTGNRPRRRLRGLLPPQPHGEDPPHPAQQLPLPQRHPRVPQGLPAPAGLSPAPEAPQGLLLRGQR